MKQSKRRMFSNVVKCSSFLSCLYLIHFVKAGDSTKLELLRERIQRLETRLSEDIASIRTEFYHELKEIADKSIESDDGEISEHISNTEGTKLEMEFDELETKLSDRLLALQLGLSVEKRARRSIESEIRVIKAEEVGIVKSIEALTENSTENLENVVRNLNVKEELFEIISLINDIKSKLSLLRDFSADVESSDSASSCLELLMSGHMTSGIYTVFPKTIWRPLKVFCDMETNGGGWTVFQRRKDGSENFNRKWLDYSFGFGNHSGEFWLGNEFIYRLTTQVPHELMIELEDFENDRRFAKYGLFSIGSADEGYTLSVNYFEGNVSDSFTDSHGGQEFSTTDHGPSTSCSKSYKGGWWYANCHGVNINGLYLRGQHDSYADGINWHGWRGHHYSLKMTEMKFRPK